MIGQKRPRAPRRLLDVTAVVDEGDREARLAKAQGEEPIISVILDLFHLIKSQRPKLCLLYRQTSILRRALCRMASGGDEAAALGGAEESDQESDDFRILPATETNTAGKFEWVGSELLPENPSGLQEADEDEGREGEAPRGGGDSNGGVAQAGAVRSFMDVEKLSKAKISARMMITNSKVTTRKRSRV